jgi:catechol 2,3-dioxygenase-like lactoylglutathione lyase family enzyme
MLAHGAYRIQVNILARDISETTLFYQRITGLALIEDESWYTLLADSDQFDFALCVIDQVSEFVPRAARGTAAGSYFTLVVRDVDAAVAAARLMDVEIIEEPQRTDQGSRAILRDPNGVVVDIVTPSARFTVPPQKRVG